MVSEEKMFENVDGRTDDGRTDAGVTGILIAHLGAFGSGELKISRQKQKFYKIQTLESTSIVIRQKPITPTTNAQTWHT